MRPDPATLITPSQRKKLAPFRRAVWAFYRRAGRRFPWRDTTDPYAILVSEVMLQQTQTERVVPKYREFLERFPSLEALSSASTAELLRVWQGLGYNRRALALQRAAREIAARHRGVVPSEPAELEHLPGIGAYTARAVALFAYGRPSTFIETNIRAVFIHAFFPRRFEVKDADLVPLIVATMPKQRVREWYYALMDYGARLKRRHRDLTARSAHYVRQGRFEGSRRQLRGAIVRFVVAHREVTRTAIERAVGSRSADLKAVLRDLEAEGFIERAKGRYRCR